MKIEIENTVDNHNKLYSLMQKYQNDMSISSLYFLKKCYCVFQDNFFKLRKILNKAKIQHKVIYNNLA